MGTHAPAGSMSPPLQHQDPVIAEFMERLLPKVRQAFRPQVVVLFGSRVHGNGDEWSDLDVLVVSDQFLGHGVYERMWRFDAATDRPLDVHPLCVTPDEFRAQAEQPTIIQEALRTGIRII